MNILTSLSSRWGGKGEGRVKRKKRIQCLKIEDVWFAFLSCLHRSTSTRRHNFFFFSSSSCGDSTLDIRGRYHQLTILRSKCAILYPSMLLLFLPEHIDIHDVFESIFVVNSCFLTGSNVPKGRLSQWQFLATTSHSRQTCQ